MTETKTIVKTTVIVVLTLVAIPVVLLIAYIAFGVLKAALFG